MIPAQIKISDNPGVQITGFELESVEPQPTVYIYFRSPFWWQAVHTCEIKCADGLTSSVRLLKEWSVHILFA